MRNLDRERRRCEEVTHPATIGGRGADCSRTDRTRELVAPRAHRVDAAGVHTQHDVYGDFAGPERNEPSA